MTVRQVIVVQLLPLLALAGEHEATGTSVVIFGAGQVVVTQPFPLVANEGMHVATGVSAIFWEHAIFTLPLPPFAVWGLHT